MRVGDRLRSEGSGVARAVEDTLLRLCHARSGEPYLTREELEAALAEGRARAEAAEAPDRQEEARRRAHEEELRRLRAR